MADFNPAPALDFASQLSASVDELRNEINEGNLDVERVNDLLDKVELFIDEFRDLEVAKAERSREVIAEYLKSECLMLGDVAYQAEKLLGQFTLKNSRASLSASLEKLETSRFKRFILIFAGVNIGKLTKAIQTFKKARNKYAILLSVRKHSPVISTLNNLQMT